MKILKKRTRKENPLRDAASLQRTFNRLRHNVLVPSGLYHFQTFEEADAWMRDQITDTHVLQNWKTSSRSAAR